VHGLGQRACGGDREVPDGGGLSAAERSALAVLVSVEGLGPLTLARLRAGIGPGQAILEAASRPDGPATLVAAGFDAELGRHMLAEPVARSIVAAASRRDEIVADVHRLGLRVVAIEDADYPARLRTIEIPPPILFVRGDLRAFAAETSIAIVGTRRPTDQGRRIASRIAASVARAGALVVSGLAVGVDGAAHAAAVNETVPTIAFIGSGHARLFPAVHDRLADAIVDGGGAVASEYAPQTRPSQGTFPRRNRLISGASDAVVVIEAGARSGALLTASWALEQGRECFLVPGPIDAAASAGCLGFLRDWPGLARVVSGVPQLLEDLGLSPSAAFARDEQRQIQISSAIRLPAPGSVALAAAKEDHAVASALLDGAVIVDEIVALTAMPVGAVLGALTRLESQGLVIDRHGRFEPAGRLARVA
jgi:DNA processing protein